LSRQIAKASARGLTTFLFIVADGPRLQYYGTIYAITSLLRDDTTPLRLKFPSRQRGWDSSAGMRRQQDGIA
jgi:hypothetical protein